MDYETVPKADVVPIVREVNTVHGELDLSTGTVTYKAIRTNEDLVRAMPKDELADFLGHFPMETICPNNCFEDPERDCAVCVREWLEQEVEV